MGTHDRSQSDADEYVQDQIRRVQTESRRQFRRMKRAWGQFDASTGSDARAKASQWANTARERGGAEIREFSEDAGKHFENAKPEIKAWAEKANNRTELIAQKLSDVIRYATRRAVLILVILGAIWLSVSLWNEVSSNMIVENEENQFATGAVADLDDEDWGDVVGRTPNDDRSDSLNPNNDAYQASMDNQSNQLNPNNDAYQSSRR